MPLKIMIYIKKKQEKHGIQIWHTEVGEIELRL